jgi:hypothetical protein
MNTIENFVGVFDDVLNPKYCQDVIDLFETSANLNFTKTRQQMGVASPMNTDTDVLCLRKNWVPDQILFNSVSENLNYFIEKSWECYSLYRKKYGALDNVGKHMFYNDVKIQKTVPGQGYHAWHCEQDNRARGSRLLLVLGYLNDVEEGGETEFLYQSLRVKPKRGTLMICPSGFTHTHRGNPPLNGTKYVINGWIELVE